MHYCTLKDLFSKTCDYNFVEIPQIMNLLHSITTSPQKSAEDEQFQLSLKIEPRL
jgi:hypothetical protein